MEVLATIIMERAMLISVGFVEYCFDVDHRLFLVKKEILKFDKEIDLDKLEAVRDWSKAHSIFNLTIINNISHSSLLNLNLTFEWVIREKLVWTPVFHWLSFRSFYWDYPLRLLHLQQHRVSTRRQSVSSASSQHLYCSCIAPNRPLRRRWSPHQDPMLQKRK